MMTRTLSSLPKPSSIWAGNGDVWLFVYGIFLDEENRQRFGMYAPAYDTVKGYITEGDVIVQARRTDNPKAALTGLRVLLDPDNWPALDQFEAGYDRIQITTTKGYKAYMYAGKEYYGRN